MASSWLLSAPDFQLSPETEAAFKVALEARTPDLLPPEVPRWAFLQWLTTQGLLLHGSQAPAITEFEPRAPNDLGDDEFSKRRAVFASSDGLWAMMYALRDRSRVRRMLNTALQLEGQGTGYFLSFAPLAGDVQDGRDLLTDGYVYVLPGEGFEQSPPYDWPGLGRVTEPQWVNPEPVRPLMCVPVRPSDFPFPVRLHDAERTDPLATSDPWGFPWLASEDER